MKSSAVVIGIDPPIRYNGVSPQQERVRRSGLSPADGIALVLLAGLVGLVVAGFFHVYALDDSYIGYDNAQNLAAGNGFAFNPGERILTTSAPLAVFLYAALSRTTGADVVEIAQIVALLACLCIAGFGYFLARRMVPPLGAFVAAATLICTPFVSLLWSHEAYLSLALVVAGVYLVARGRHFWGASLLGLAALFRPEALLAVMLAAYSVQIATNSRRKAAYVLLAGLAPFLIWAVGAYIYFGTFISQTLAAKQAQLGYAAIGPYLWGALRFSTSVERLALPSAPASAIWVAVLICWLTAAARHAITRVHLAVIGWALILTLGYIIAGLPIFLWYCVQFGVVLALTPIVAWSRSKPSLPAATDRLMNIVGKGSAVAILILSVAIPTAIAAKPRRIDNLNSFAVQARYHESAYLAIGGWLRERSSPLDSIAYPEIGQLRYYSQRPIVDFEGAVNAGVAAHLRVGDAIWAFKRYRPALYIDSKGWHSFVNPLEYDWFSAAYRQVGVAKYVGTREHVLVVYRLVAPAAMPPVDELDPNNDVKSAGSTNSAAFVSFDPSRPRLDSVDLRIVAPRGCARGQITLASASGVAIWNRSFVLKSSMTPIRVTISGDSILGSAGQTYRVALEGCPDLKLAPRRKLRKFSPFVVDNPPVQDGAAAYALSVYERQ
jgi:hypothetical protein